MPHGTEMSTCRSGIRPDNQYSVQMYDSCVTSISDYASEVTGYRLHPVPTLARPSHEGNHGLSGVNKL